MLEPILADQVADLTPLGQATSGQEWQFHISTVRAHIDRSPVRYTPQVQTSSGQEWQYEIATVRAHIGRLTDISSSGQEWHFHISTVRAHIGRSLGRSNPPGMGN